MGELEVGEKFAEGGEAELYNAHVTWWKPEYNEKDLRDKREFVVKVFKKGAFLKHLKSQLPQGLLQQHVEDAEYSKSLTSQVFPRYFCKVHCGILLEYGRFAFLIAKDHFDLRNLIDSHGDGIYKWQRLWTIFKRKSWIYYVWCCIRDEVTIFFVELN